MSVKLGKFKRLIKGERYAIGLHKPSGENKKVYVSLLVNYGTSRWPEWFAFNLAEGDGLDAFNLTELEYLMSQTKSWLTLYANKTDIGWEYRQ